MIRSDEKVRQMVRSLLPAKGREHARWNRARVHRAARSETRRELALWLRDWDLEEDVPPCAPWEDSEVRGAMEHRRASDKVNPFIRWATARTRGLAHEARRSHVRSLLPRGVIGEHAWSHLKRTPAFEDVAEAARTRHSRLRDERRERQLRKGAVLDRGEQTQLLRALLQEAGGQRLLNRFLRERHAWTRTLSLQAPAKRWVKQLPPHRPLLGVHDVDAFLDSLQPNAWGSFIPVWGPLTPTLHQVRLFLQLFKAHRGHIPSVRAALEAEGLLDRDPPVRSAGRATAARLREPPDR